MSDKPEKFIDENGLRLDGRKVDQIRDMKIEVGTLSRADGSCYLEFGNNKVIAAVYGPREVHPRHQQKSTRAIVRYRYNMASFSVEDRKRPGPDRRSTEVSKVSREAFENQVFTEFFPKSAIDIFIEVLQADAGTRTAAINAASIALADAGIPMRGLICSCAVGKVDDTLVLDLNKDEDNYGQADMPIAMTPDGKITLLQMDGHLTLDEFKKGLEMAQEGCMQIYQLQRKALLDHYNKKQVIKTVTVEETSTVNFIEQDAVPQAIDSTTEDNTADDSTVEDNNAIEDKTQDDTIQQVMIKQNEAAEKENTQATEETADLFEDIDISNKLSGEDNTATNELDETEDKSDE
jgi:exosome complex component RRP41